MKTGSSVLDASALLAYLKREEGYEMVKAALSAASADDVYVLMNETNLGEVYYIIVRERSLEAARYFLYERLPLLPIKLLPNALADVTAAAELKARLGLHYADAFAAATANQRNAVLLTSDRDFEKATDEIEIHWLK